MKFLDKIERQRWAQMVSLAEVVIVTTGLLLAGVLFVAVTNALLAWVS